MLFGKLSKNIAVVEKVEVPQNKLSSTIRFEVDPVNVAAAITEAEKDGLEFIGLFHSHPAPSAPSSVDLKYMRLWGGRPLANSVFNWGQPSCIPINRWQIKESNYKNRITQVTRWGTKAFCCLH